MIGGETEKGLWERHGKTEKGCPLKIGKSFHIRRWGVVKLKSVGGGGKKTDRSGQKTAIR